MTSCRYGAQAASARTAHHRWLQRWPIARCSACLPVLVVGNAARSRDGRFRCVQAAAGGIFSRYQGWDEYPGDAGASAEEAVIGRRRVVSRSATGCWACSIPCRTSILTAITWVGRGAVLIYSTIGSDGHDRKLVSMRSTARRRGALGRRRMPIYWTVLTLGPAALAGAVYAGNQFDAMLGDRRVVDAHSRLFGRSGISWHCGW